jgi:DNA-binding IclR family transcriptional regulator
MPRHSNFGVQAVDRAIAILRLLGEAGTHGLRVVDIQATLGLTRPTAHRLTNALVRQGLAAIDPEARRYYLGFEAAVIGWSATKQSFDLREICQEALQHIARDTGDTAILVARSGDEGVVIDHKAGPHPIEAMTVQVGARRPLGAGATGVAILASLADGEVNRVMHANRHKLGKYHHLNEQLIRRALRAARAAGYAISEGMLLPKLRGVAVPLMMGSRAIGALGVTTVGKLTKARVSFIAQVLGAQRRLIERRLTELGDAGVRGTYASESVDPKTTAPNELIE